MGTTSSQVKHQWNACNYTQIKVSIKPDLAAAFKSACIASDTSMARILSQFMKQFSNTASCKGGYSPDLASRRQRRAALRSLIQQLERIMVGEERYRDNIPDNLQGSASFDRADQCVSVLQEALELLESAY
jgi:hypothetical protein